MTPSGGWASYVRPPGIRWASPSCLSIIEREGNPGYVVLGWPDALRNLPMTSSARLLLVVLFALPAHFVSAAMTLQLYAPEKHDRFYTPAEPSDPEKAFIGDPYDWSGVGVRHYGWYEWATMISPQYFLSADHFHPSDGSRVRFYHTNDGDGSYEEHYVESGVQIGDTDLWLGKLETPVSSNVAYYPILSLPRNPLYNNIELFTFGKADSTDAMNNTRVGRNEIDPNMYFETEVEKPTGGYSTGFTYYFDFDDSGGMEDDESYLQRHDSGAPSFVIYNGLPALTGIHWFIWEDDEDPSIVGSADSFVRPYVDEINAAMASEQLMLLSNTTKLIWDGLGDSNWNSPQHWAGGEAGEIPHLATKVAIGTDAVTVTVDAMAESLSVKDGGALEIGSTAALWLDGNLDFANAAELVFDLHGNTAGSVRAAGNVRLGTGSILTLRIDGTSPFLAGTHTLIDAQGVTGISGTFTTTSDLGIYALSGGPAYDAGKLTLDILHDLLQADANLDGSTDVRDFNAWNTAKFTNGTDWATGDFNNDGTTDVRDFNVWNTAKFTSIDLDAATSGIHETGFSSGFDDPSSSSIMDPSGDSRPTDPSSFVTTQVPEPGTLVLLLLGGLLGLGWRLQQAARRS